MLKVFCHDKKEPACCPVGTKWGVKGEGNSRYTKVTDTQREATAVARSIARNMQSELVIHGKDGRIRQKDSYGNDPFPPRG